MKRSFDDLDPTASRAGEALAMVECAAIADGYAAADRALKAAPVRLLLARPASPGKFLLLFAGSPSAATSSLRAAVEGLPAPPLATLLLPQVEPEVVGALAGEAPSPRGEAAGVVECATVATLLLAADVALKTADVALLQLRAAAGLGGKAFLVLCGEVSQVEAGVAAARRFAEERGHLVATVILSQPHGELARWLAAGGA